MKPHPRRRVRTAVPPGSDPTPPRLELGDGGPEVVRAELAAEDRPEAWGDDGPEVRPDDASGSNDAALRENTPPHHV